MGTQPVRNTLRRNALRDRGRAPTGGSTRARQLDVVVTQCDSTARATPNEEATVDVDIQNTGSSRVGWGYEVFVGETSVIAEQFARDGLFSLEPGATVSVTHNFVPAEEGLGPGTYTVTAFAGAEGEAMSPLICSTLEVVEEGAPPPEGDLILQSCNVSPGPFPSDEDVQVGWEVVNNTNQVQDFQFDIEVGGTVVTTVNSQTSPSLDPLGPGQGTSSAEVFVPADVGVPAGTHQVVVSDVNCGQVTIGQQDGGGGNGGGGTPGGGGQGGGDLVLPLAALGLVGLAWAATRQ